MKRELTRQGYPLFPKTIGEFQRRFLTEESCIRYLFLVRWPNGFDCPRCHYHKAWPEGVRSYRCRMCRKKISVTAETVMDKTHLSLRYWFWAAYLMSTLTPGISALQLMRQLGIGSYRTALYLCRRLRKAMVNPEREPLTGVIEVDDTYVGGSERGTRGRQTETKVPVVVAVENRGDHTGRIRLEMIYDVSSESLHPFVRKNITPGSQINTDGWRGYWGVESYGYKHRPRVQGKPERAAKILPWVHRVIGNLKTWLRGTHHGVDREHLPEYLDEYTFRYNRRHYRESSFLTMLIIATKVRPLRLRAKSLSPSSA